jgi:hypothetical protein
VQRYANRTVGTNKSTFILIMVLFAKSFSDLSRSAMLAANVLQLRDVGLFEAPTYKLPSRLFF